MPVSFLPDRGAQGHSLVAPARRLPLPPRRVMMVPAHRPGGCKVGMVQMSSPDEASLAIAALNGTIPRGATKPLQGAHRPWPPQARSAAVPAAGATAPSSPRRLTRDRSRHRPQCAWPATHPGREARRPLPSWPTSPSPSVTRSTTPWPRRLTTCSRQPATRARCSPSCAPWWVAAHASRPRPAAWALTLPSPTSAPPAATGIAVATGHGRDDPGALWGPGGPIDRPSATPRPAAAAATAAIRHGAGGALRHGVWRLRRRDALRGGGRPPSHTGEQRPEAIASTDYGT